MLVQSALTAAEVLMQHGLPCFPCAATKRPTCPHGFKDATANCDELRALWAAYPGPLVGVATGEVSKLTVVDIDAKHPEAKSWWTENRDRLPTTRAHRTRSGGLHLLFRYVPGINCSAGKIARGVDVRNDGGYVIDWPSAGYPVLRHGPIAELPTWLYRALLPPPPAPPRKIVPISVLGNRRALRGLIRVVATAAEGERNRTLFWSACRFGEMVAAGKLSEPDAIAILVEAAARAGLPQYEATRTVHSGLRAGAGDTHGRK